MICTFYAHRGGFDTIVHIVESTFSKAKISISKEGESDVIEVEIKGGLFKSASRLRIQYRQKDTFSYRIEPNDNSALTNNLRGLYGYATSLPCSNDQVKQLFLQKILTVNCEFSVAQQGEIKEMKSLLQQLAIEFDAILFVQPGTIISKSSSQHFLDKNLKLITDLEGNCEIDTISVQILSDTFDTTPTALTEDQTARKSRSEAIIKAKNISWNANLPCTNPEAETTIRTPTEIAQRVCILALTNLVAFNHIDADTAENYLSQYELWDFVTPGERDFLNDPTEERKSHETWKCECIWTLLWAINKVDDLPFPAELANLGNIPPGNYPVSSDKDPNDFIRSVTGSRSKSEIMDAADLYYRLDWACVDARIKGNEMSAAHPGVVYERHYALNWLVNYLNQDWDDVSCDT